MKLVEASVQKSTGDRPSPDLDQPQQKGAAPKVYPQSSLFTKWGDGLSEEEQREAQGLFELYGYNVFLSNQLPLDRKLPDTRDYR